MAEGEKDLCHDCSGRWDNLRFWEAALTPVEASQEKWGQFHRRKFGEIRGNQQCAFCKLVCYALTNSSRTRVPTDEDMIYFSRTLFGEYKIGDSYAHLAESQRPDIEVGTRQVHQINRLRVSTFSGRSNVSREFVRLSQGGQYLCEVYEGHIALLREPNHERHFLCGRRMESTFNVDLFRHWIELCNTAHTDNCSSSLTPGKEWPARVINIQERKVQHTPPFCSYAALSYRWPTSPSLFLTSSTEARLMANGGLSDHFDDILPVIKDSIVLAENLGQKYIWIDALCIPQEEESQDPDGPMAKERTCQLQAMKEIYRKAHFTIVACSDPDSGLGLPGMQERSRPRQRRMENGDLAYAVVKPNLNKAVKDSSWNSRIWTFQEAAESCRLLIFTRHQVFFVCNQATWYEDIFFEPSLHGKGAVQDVDIPDVEMPFWRYRSSDSSNEFSDWAEAVEKYTLRRASRESDFPRGLDFIRERIVAPYLCCLPEKYFAQALCFEAWKGRRSLLGSPTWCWCAWKTPNGICYPSQSEFIPRDLYTAPQNVLIPVEIDGGAQVSPRSLQAIQDFMHAFPISSGIEMRYLVILHTRVQIGTLVPNPDEADSYVHISLPFFDDATGSDSIRVIATACLAVDCGIENGDPVFCVELGLHVSNSEVWLLLVENDEYGISRRIGIGTINLDDWEEVVGPRQILYLG